MTSPLTQCVDIAEDNMSALVRFENKGDIALITLDDNKANALSPELLLAFSAALDRAEKEAKALVLAGRAGRFCAGYDLKVMMSGKEPATALVTSGAQLMARLYCFPMPVVVACTGHAMAGGALLLLCADVRLGTEGPFKIGLNEVQIGIPLPAFGLDLARDRLDPRKFTAATITAEVFTPSAAVEAGFLDELVDADTLLDDATARATALATLSNSAYARTKRGARQGTADKMLAELAANLDALLAGK